MHNISYHLKQKRILFSRSPLKHGPLYEIASLGKCYCILANFGIMWLVSMTHQIASWYQLLAIDEFVFFTTNQNWFIAV